MLVIEVTQSVYVSEAQILQLFCLIKRRLLHNNANMAEADYSHFCNKKMQRPLSINSGLNFKIQEIFSIRNDKKLFLREKSDKSSKE